MPRPADFDDAIARILAARVPADLFGTAHDEHLYRAYAKLVHPDRVPPTRIGDAHRAFAALTALWRSAGTELGRDDIATYLRDGDDVLKVVRRPADNDLMEREEAALRALAGSRQAAYFPVLREVLICRDPGTGADRRAHRFAPLAGFVRLSEVHAAYPGGLDPRDAAWMWRRLLVALGAAHRAGVVHGAVLPDAVLIHPELHGLVLVDWCHASVEPHQVVPSMIARYRDWYPPEVPAKGRPTPGTDIFLATRTVADLVGDRMPERLGRFVRGCLPRLPAARPDDAWRVLAELDELLEKVYGARRFRPFAVDATVPEWPVFRR